MLRSQRGFSISEMLTAVVVTALLAGIAAPKLGSLADHYRLSGTARELAFDIGRARMQAIGENVFTRVRMGNTYIGAVYWIETSDDGWNYSIDGPFKWLPHGILFAATPDVIPRFNRLGLMPATSKLVLYNPRDEQQTIVVSTVGKISLRAGKRISDDD